MVHQQLSKPSLVLEIKGLSTKANQTSVTLYPISPNTLNLAKPSSVVTGISKLASHALQNIAAFRGLRVQLLGVGVSVYQRSASVQDVEQLLKAHACFDDAYIAARCLLAHVGQPRENSTCSLRNITKQLGDD